MGNISKAGQTKNSGSDLLSERELWATVIEKMLIMPVIGVVAVIFFTKYVWDVAESVRAPFLLVAMTEFITPTANNVMIMLELSGSKARPGVAKSIGYQYAIAPVILTLTLF